MEYYLLSQKLLFKDFKGLVTRTTHQVLLNPCFVVLPSINLRAITTALQ